MGDSAFRIEPRRLVFDHLREHALRTPEREAIVHVVSDEPPYRWRWGPLLRAASGAARWLAAKGVQKGDVCALIVRHHSHFYPLYLGISALGALPAVLAYPNPRLHPDKLRQGLEGMAMRSGLDHVLTEGELSATVEPLLSGGRSTIQSILYPLEASAETFREAELPIRAEAVDSDAPCLLQHSSGTTGLQKPVVLSHRAVLQHLLRYSRAIELTPDDRVVSWLPLYHDMGLIAAFYLPLVCGVPLVQLSPMEWVASPAMLLREISNEGGTLSWLPNFAYSFMAARIREEDLEGVRLERLRLLVNCSEPVRAESHQRFFQRMAPYGLRRESLGACYAMAETTFAVTQTPPGVEARQVCVDRSELALGRVVPVPGTEGPSARLCVSSGIPLPGCSLRLMDGDVEVTAGGMGEIVVASESLFEGYRNYPEKTAEVLADGWYRTGDLGFLHEGECYVVGRKKDLIVVAGNKLFPEDVEALAATVAGVIAGRVVAFGAEDVELGTETLCVVVESDVVGEDAQRRLRLDILRAGMTSDVSIARVYVAAPRWLVKSSSGKLARAANRDRALVELTWK
jgi:acyl-CoA synthetase (AMP-forming)/AMP-acid ligase II